MVRGLALVDTNVLLSATDPTRRHHRSAVRLLDADERELATSPQVLREYLAVATRPVEVNGLGLGEVLAVDNARILARSLRLLDEDHGTVDRLLRLVLDGRALGRQVHDANIVAVALAHGASAIVTSDTRHFSRFSDLVQVEELLVLP